MIGFSAITWPWRACAESLRSQPRLWTLAFLGAALLSLSFQPFDLWPLAWIAPIPWLLLIRGPALGGRRPYVVIGLAGFCLWMVSLYWMCLPHWASTFGWIALAFYYSLYLPAFVGLSRVAVHRLRVPIMLAAPIVWTGLELFRAHFITGLSLGSLGYTQDRWLTMIQIADLAGAYGVGFVMMFVAASLARMLSCQESVPLLGTSSAACGPTDTHCLCQAVAHAGKKSSFAFWPLLPAAALLFAALLYGHVRLGQHAGTVAKLDVAGPRIALLQGSIDVTLQYDPKLRPKMADEYFGLAEQAVKESAAAGQKVDLMVWPESMFPEHVIASDVNAKWLPEFGRDEAELRKSLAEIRQREAKGDSLRSRTARAFHSAQLMGVDIEYYSAEGPQCYNAAVYVARDGRQVGVYKKNHLVPFGEYVPFADRFPWLQRLTPLPISATAGTCGESFELRWGDGRTCRFSPNICYETIMSHLIRRQINQLTAEGHEPDFLVNVTNDGWFWGSSELDMHLVCAVFRAVECRKPFLIAANTGFSASIDSDGRVLERGPRRAVQLLFAQPEIAHRTSWYLRHGDWFSGVCLAVTVFFAAVGLWDRRKKRISN